MTNKILNDTLSSMSMLFFQGVFAGGAVCSLNRQDRSKSLASTLFHCNHLLLLTGMILKETRLQPPYFSLAARSVFLITPILFLADIKHQKNITLLETKIGNRFSQICLTVSVLASLALLALGNRAFAIGSLLCYSIHLTCKESKVFTYAAHTAAFFAFLGYTSRIFHSDSTLNKIAMVGTSLLVIYEIGKRNIKLAPATASPTSTPLTSSNTSYPPPARNTTFEPATTSAASSSYSPPLRNFEFEMATTSTDLSSIPMPWPDYSPPVCYVDSGAASFSISSFSPALPF